MQRGQVFKRPGRSWAYRIYSPPAPRTGQRQRIQKGGFRTKAEAVAAMEETLRQIRLGLLVRDVYPAPITLADLVEEFLAQHQGEPYTIETLRVRLRYATRAFGEMDVRELTAREIAAWRAQLPPKSAHGIHAALRQCLNYAIRTKILSENPAREVRNPKPKPTEQRPYESLAQIEAVGEELGPVWEPFLTFGCATGLRPQELVALERGDVEDDVVHVRRVLTNDGRFRTYGKTDASLRSVPLTDLALEALSRVQRRIDTKLLFPAVRGGPLDLHNFRARVWAPAHEAAGVALRRFYDMRHTYATWMIASDVSLYHLATVMGTSVEMIDRTYGHLFPDAHEVIRRKFNGWLSEQRANTARFRP